MRTSLLAFNAIDANGDPAATSSSSSLIDGRDVSSGTSGAVVAPTTTATPTMFSAAADAATVTSKSPQLTTSITTNTEVPQRGRELMVSGLNEGYYLRKLMMA